MSDKHLTTGSTRPPNVEGLLRLYSMKFCPFAQRARLVLKAKGIPHDIVNINLINKPDWYFQVHPEGKVPALDTGSKVIVESLDVCDYLDENYAENPLYPAEPAAKQKDKELIAKIGPVAMVFHQCVFENSEKSPEEWLKQFLDVLEVFENALKDRGTIFFGGAKPGMVDFMLWPWAERTGLVAIKYGKSLPLQKDQLPLLRKWAKAMRVDPVCDEIYCGPEKVWACAQFKLQGAKPDYDSI